MSYEIVESDALEYLKTLDTNTFDGCFCDPPYGINFMGHEWDHGVPSEVVWSEVLRVIKPGAHLFAFGGRETHHRLMVNIEDAGFEIRDCFMWLYGSGIPNGAKLKGKFEGYNSKSKPAYEPIVSAMKQKEGTYADNAVKHGVAGLNIEDSRIECSQRLNVEQRGGVGETVYGKGRKSSRTLGTTTQGRFPANIVFDENIRDDLHPQAHDKFDNFYFYCTKASKDEREAGLSGEGRQNIHPCVKPLDLCRYFATMMLPPKRDTDRRLLVPYSGSGSEMIGSLIAGWDDVVGIDNNSEYIEIARKRLKHWVDGGIQQELF